MKCTHTCLFSGDFKNEMSVLPSGFKLILFYFLCFDLTRTAKGTRASNESQRSHVQQVFGDAKVTLQTPQNKYLIFLKVTPKMSVSVD